MEVLFESEEMLFWFKDGSGETFSQDFEKLVPFKLRYENIDLFELQWKHIGGPQERMCVWHDLRARNQTKSPAFSTTTSAIEDDMHSG